MRMGVIMATPSVKERLTTAAFALFDERGYEHSTVDDIVERAGVGRTTFFRAFPSKEDVILPDHRVVLDAIRAPEQAGFGACRSDLVGHGHRHGHHFLGWVLLSLRMLSCHQPRVRGPWTDVRKPSER